MTFEFSSSQRIRQSKEFEAAFRHKGINNKWFTIHLVDSKHNIPRLGMVVSKRIIAKSVNRNFAKRLIRESFRLNAAQLPARDFIVRIKRKLTDESVNEAKDALLQLMLSTKIL